MTDEELERLRKKVEKDPLSKLFVPLAEEYKKRGIVDEAINTLLTALENQPNYTSAMIALGKIYLQKGMLSEARDEFEKAIDLIPNNLLAHKMLADIYYKQGEIDKAVKEYQTILNLNPDNGEAKTMILSLESCLTASEEPKEQAEPAQTNDLQKPTETAEQHIVESAKETPVYEIYEEVSGAELGIEIPEKLTPVVEEPVSKELEEFQKIMELHSKESPAKVQEQLDVVPLAEEIQEDHRDKEDKITVSMSTETMADIFIMQGLYDKAMDIYKEILSSDPDNKRIIQKCEELKMLIKLKDKKPLGQQR